MRTRQWLVVPLVAFAASRLLTVAVAFAVRFVAPGAGVLDVFTQKWDSTYYLDIARHGYPTVVPDGQSTLGFFPLYPLLTRAVSEALHIDLRLAAFVVNTVAAAIAVVLLWRLAQRLLGDDIADRTVFLFCFFPGAYCLSLAYSEGVFLAFAVGCLLLLEQRRWWWAAAVAGIGSAARPTGYALAVACAFAVVVHWRRTRQWTPLLSPALAASGFLAFLAYLHVHTGDALAYQRVQERGWGQGIDAGTTTLRHMVDFVTKNRNDLNLLVPSVAVLLAVVLLVVLVRSRPPGTHIAFSVATLVPGFLSTSVALTPRHLLVAFPLFIAAAKLLAGNAYACTLALCAGTLALLMFLIGGTFALTP